MPGEVIVHPASAGTGERRLAVMERLVALGINTAADLATFAADVAAIGEAVGVLPPRPSVRPEPRIVHVEKQVEVERVVERIVEVEKVVERIVHVGGPADELFGDTAQGWGAMEAEAAEVAGRKVALQLYRGSIELARAALEEAWVSHQADRDLPSGPALLEEPVSRVLDDVRLLNKLEEYGIVTVAQLIHEFRERSGTMFGVGDKHRAALGSLVTSLRQRVFHSAESPAASQNANGGGAALRLREGAGDAA